LISSTKLPIAFLLKTSPDKTQAPSLPQQSSMNDWAHPKAGFASEMNDNGMGVSCAFLGPPPPPLPNPKP